jgi:putative phage-type endonuclease
MKIINLKQNSAEWLKFRKSHLGASEAACIHYKCPYQKPHGLWGEKVGFVKPFYMNVAMIRGKVLEETARNQFSSEFNKVFEPIVVECTIPGYEFMSASLDGMSLDKEILEIKCNGKKWHKVALDGKVPDHHMFQLQHQLFVCEAYKAYYYSFDGENGISLEVERDEEMIKEIKKYSKKFWDMVDTLTWDWD